MDVGRKTDKADHQTLSLCAQHLRRLGALTHAAEMYKYVINIPPVIFADKLRSTSIQELRKFSFDVYEML